jgi:hypothetical protein
MLHFKQGGHFVALEFPDVLWKDIEEFVKGSWQVPS